MSASLTSELVGALVLFLTAAAGCMQGRSNGKKIASVHKTVNGTLARLAGEIVMLQTTIAQLRSDKAEVTATSAAIAANAAAALIDQGKTTTP